MKMKIKNPPSSAFYTKMYEIIKDFISDSEVFSDIDIKIINTPGYEDFVQKNGVEIGYVTRKRNKKGQLSYRIELIELHSLKFGDHGIKELIDWRYLEYLTNLELTVSPEIVTILTLLHELGHVESFEKFFKLLELSKCEHNVLTSYLSVVKSVYVATFKPWEYAGFLDENISNIMYNSIESYPELFALKHFPMFIKTIKENGGLLNEHSC